MPETRYDRITGLAHRRIMQLRKRGLLDWVIPDNWDKNSPAYKQAFEKNQQALLNSEDYIYKTLQSAMQKEIGRMNSPSPEQVAAAACEEWLRHYPEAYAKIEHMRFVG